MSSIKKSPFIDRFVENLGSLLLDMAKLSFGSLVLGGVINGSTDRDMLFTVGLIGSAIAGAIGLVLVSMKKD
jgi:hypothetical protein